jgi:hypothetical protein
MTEKITLQLKQVVRTDEDLKDDYTSNYPNDIDLNKICADKMTEDESYHITIVLQKA